MTDPDVVAELEAAMNAPYGDIRPVIKRARDEIVALRIENDAFRDRLSEMIAEKVAIAQLEPWQFQPEDDTPGLFIACVNAEQRERIIHALKDNPA